MEENKIIKGSLAVIILQLLHNNGSMYGYEMGKAVSACTGGALMLTEAALYQSLHKLEAEGLLESRSLLSGNRLRKYYLLSRKGKRKAAPAVAQLKDSISALQKVLRYRAPGKR